MTFLTVTGINKRYGKVVALEDVTIDVPSGCRTAIVGHSGSGKTTLLRLIAGFEVPDSGAVVLDGKFLADGAAVVPAHRRGIGIVAQHGALFPHLTVGDNIGFGLDRNIPQRTERISALMDLVELARSMRDRRPHELSGGQQQRVALARALARQPKLMLLDEPFSALDAGLREGIRTSVAEVLNAQKITTLLVTHDQAEALSFADQVAVLRDGKLLQIGSPRTLYLSPNDPYTASFLGDAIILDAEFSEGLASCALGRVKTDSARIGTAKIMLRPEQVVLSPVSPNAPDDPDRRSGYITRIEFGGASCSITIRLTGDIHDGSTKPPLVIRTASVNLPPIGSHVQICVLGEAHVFEGT
jgi:iron(III) transport system ATP-binding protein